MHPPTKKKPPPQPDLNSATTSPPNQQCPPIVELTRFIDIFPPSAADPQREAARRRSSSTVEHRFRKAGVKGSNPFFGFAFTHPANPSISSSLRLFLSYSSAIHFAFLLKFVTINRMLLGRAG